MFDSIDRIWADDGRREAFVGFGHYEEEYARLPDGWRIASVRLTRLRFDALDVATLPPFPHRDADPSTFDAYRRD